LRIRSRQAAAAVPVVDVDAASKSKKFFYLFREKIVLRVYKILSFSFLQWRVWRIWRVKAHLSGMMTAARRSSRDGFPFE
jgi:hypothetical protein